MKPIFVKQWHGIALNTVKGFNAKEIPGKEFYADFYRKFFQTHENWDDLDSDWVDHKVNSARFIQGRLKGMERVLSIGCGIGIIEKYLLDSGAKDLEIQEVSEEPLKWIRPLFSSEVVHIGRLPECQDHSRKYDYIFLSCVDYCFEFHERIEFLDEIKGLLNQTGRCLVIAPTFHLSNFECSELKLWIMFKIKKILSALRIYDLGQFVGWRRHKNEFHHAMVSAGFNVREEGFLNKDAMFSKTYWIEGEPI